MEILSIHPRSFQAFHLETQGSSQPNGLTKDSNKQTQNASVISSLGLVGTTAASKSESSQSSDHSLKILQLAIDKRIDDIALLEDEEEQSALGLKAFYTLLISILDNNKNKEFYDDLVLRFHRGSLSLSRYHSAHEGMMNRETFTNSLISKNGYFYNCDDAGTFLETFINKAFAEERKEASSFLNTLKDALIDKKLSAKTKERWEYIVNKVMDRLQAENSRISILQPSRSLHSRAELNLRRQDLLLNWVPKPKEHKEENETTTLLFKPDL
jgi:hypothetical protein